MKSAANLRAGPVALLLVAAPAAGQVATPPDPTPASGASDSQRQPEPPATLTGEWGGLRTRLRTGGIDLSLGYVGEFAANVAGGRRKDAAESGQFTFGASIDTGKAIGLEGGTLQASITYRRGKDLGALADLGVLQQVQEVYGRGQTWRLTELWYQQQFRGGVDLKVGRLPQGADFNSFSCQFQNLSFCGAPAGNIAGDYWYNWPIAQWGARLRLKRTDWYVMAGAYENNPRNLDNKFILSRHGATGVLAPGEFGWTPRMGASRLPGSYRIGGWYNTSNGDDVLLGRDRRPAALTGLEPLRRSGRYGAYILLQQQLTGTATEDPKTGPKATRGLTVFLNVTQADRATTVTDNQIATGLFLVGPFAGRRDDDVGIALARTQVSGRAGRAIRLASRSDVEPGAEYAAELHYSVHVTPWLIVRPNLQYIHHPGGYSAARDVVVLGAKTAITL